MFFIPPTAPKPFFPPALSPPPYFPSSLPPQRRHAQHARVACLACMPLARLRACNPSLRHPAASFDRSVLELPSVSVTAAALSPLPNPPPTTPPGHAPPHDRRRPGHSLSRSLPLCLPAGQPAAAPRPRGGHPCLSVFLARQLRQVARSNPTLGGTHFPSHAAEDVRVPDWRVCGGRV